MGGGNRAGAHLRGCKQRAAAHMRLHVPSHGRELQQRCCRVSHGGRLGRRRRRPGESPHRAEQLPCGRRGGPTLRRSRPTVPSCCPVGGGRGGFWQLSGPSGPSSFLCSCVQGSGDRLGASQHCQSTTCHLLQSLAPDASSHRHIFIRECSSDGCCTCSFTQGHRLWG